MCWVWEISFVKKNKKNDLTVQRHSDKRALRLKQLLITAVYFLWYNGTSRLVIVFVFCNYGCTIDSSLTEIRRGSVDFSYIFLYIFYMKRFSDRCQVIFRYIFAHTNIWWWYILSTETQSSESFNYLSLTNNECVISVLLLEWDGVGYYKIGWLSWRKI